MNIKALLTVVSQVPSASLVEGDMLVYISLPWSDNSCSTNSKVLSLLVGNGVSSLGKGSDGVSSSVEDEPLLGVLGVVVSDSKSELVGTDVFSPEEGSVGLHLGFDLELNSVSKWISWVSPSELIDLPSLVGSVMAVVEDNVTSVGVRTTVDIKALSSDHLNCSSRFVDPSHSLVNFVFELSADSSNVNPVFLSSLVGECKASSVERSDSFGSGVE